LEKEINLNISKKVTELFESHPYIKVYATRTEDVTLAREARAVFANGIGDMFISIHANAMTGNALPNGIETWYWPHSNDAQIGLSCINLAEIINRNLVQATGAFNRGLKTDDLVVLRETRIPAVLVEVGFMTNPAELAKLITEAYQWQIAQGIYRGIVEAFNRYTPIR
jgi:N-acetylmuramoyl-L-alanine amidase